MSSHKYHNPNSYNKHRKQRAFENGNILNPLYLPQREIDKSTVRGNVLEWTRFGISGCATDLGNSSSLSESQVSPLQNIDDYNNWSH